ncbi:MAG TPA: hypothetical protein VL240_04975 [Candidatus Binatia bacterium]|nr:hypothetical protein [Candidatus Binatia bacterium]
MKKITGWISLVVFGLALCAPMVLDARTHSNHPEAPAQVQKSAKSYDKQLRKSQKQQAKLQKKQMKQWKKQHQTTTRTVI